MKAIPLINVYVFDGGEQVRKISSDERIRRCASLFVESERKKSSELSGLWQKDLPAIKRPKDQKPCFETDIGLHFSVSHSGAYWVCAFSEQKVGIDIQRKTNNYQRGIAKRFFHFDEQEYLEKNNFTDFFQIWTAKESYVKYTGQGILEGFSDFSVVAGGRISEQINGVRIRFLSFDPDYCLCLCAAGIGEIEPSYL